MTYNQYKVSRDMAWDILIDHTITTLPVHIAPLMEELGITLQTFSEAAPVLETLGVADRTQGRDAYTVRIKNGALVCYNDARPMRRIRFTLAHELGHLCLGHITPASGREDVLLHLVSANPDNEAQADAFAARLLSPACVLWGLGLHTAQEIAAVCDISITAAQVRERRMAVLYQREAEWLRAKGYSCFCSSPKERQLYEQFAPYIRQWAARVS